jgi:hypothetical protein
MAHYCSADGNVDSPVPSQKDANTRDTSNRPDTGQETTEFNWSHCIERPFSGCAGFNWGTGTQLARDTTYTSWTGPPAPGRSRRCLGRVCPRISCQNFVKNTQSTIIPWAKYNTGQNSIH